MNAILSSSFPTQVENSNKISLPLNLTKEQNSVLFGLKKFLTDWKEKGVDDSTKILKALTEFNNKYGQVCRDISQISYELEPDINNNLTAINKLIEDAKSLPKDFEFLVDCAKTCQQLVEQEQIPSQKTKEVAQQILSDQQQTTDFDLSQSLFQTIEKLNTNGVLLNQKNLLQVLAQKRNKEETGEIKICLNNHNCINTHKESLKKLSETTPNTAQSIIEFVQTLFTCSQDIENLRSFMTKYEDQHTAYKQSNIHSLADLKKMGLTPSDQILTVEELAKFVDDWKSTITLLTTQQERVKTWSVQYFDSILEGIASLNQEIKAIKEAQVEFAQIIEQVKEQTKQITTDKDKVYSSKVQKLSEKLDAPSLDQLVEESAAKIINEYDERADHWFTIRNYMNDEDTLSNISQHTSNPSLKWANDAISVKYEQLKKLAKTTLDNAEVAWNWTGPLGIRHNGFTHAVNQIMPKIVAEVRLSAPQATIPPSWTEQKLSPFDPLFKVPVDSSK